MCDDMREGITKEETNRTTDGIKGIIFNTRIKENRIFCLTFLFDDIQKINILTISSFLSSVLFLSLHQLDKLRIINTDV
jgi:hypothetical protein